MGWKDAFLWCQAKGMEMAMFRTMEELENISNELKNRELGETNNFNILNVQNTCTKLSLFTSCHPFQKYEVIFFSTSLFCIRFSYVTFIKQNKQILKLC
jgi:hypothetical protein